MTDVQIVKPNLQSGSRRGLTPSEKQDLKRRIAEILYRDDHRATYKAIADFLGVGYRGMMRKQSDPHSEHNARIVAASTGTPPGYTAEELRRFNFNPTAKLWLPGVAFDVHMTARLAESRAEVHPSAGGTNSCDAQTRNPTAGNASNRVAGIATASGSRTTGDASVAHSADTHAPTSYS